MIVTARALVSTFGISNAKHRKSIISMLWWSFRQCFSETDDSGVPTHLRFLNVARCFASRLSAPVRRSRPCWSVLHACVHVPRRLVVCMRVVVLSIGMP